VIQSNYRSSLLTLSAGIGLGILSGVALSQATSSNTLADHSDASLPLITIEASHQVQKKQVGKTYTGISIEQVSLSRHISYRDLNLNTPAGTARLEKRIKATAQEACDQLKSLYPLDIWDTDNRQCISGAVERAMQQAKNLEATRQGNS
jgi:UrcA family protein